MLKKITIFSIIIILLSLILFTITKTSNEESLKEAQLFEDGSANYVSLMINNINRENAEFRVTPLVAARNMNYIMLAGYLAYSESSKELSAEGSSIAAAMVTANYIYGSEKKSSWITRIDRNYNIDKASLEFGQKIGQKVIAIAKKDNYLKTYNERGSRGKVTPRTDGYSWVTTGRDEPGLEPLWGSLIPLISENKKCILPSPDLNEVENQSKIMLENYNDKNAFHSDVLFWLAGVATDTPSGQWMRIFNNKLSSDKGRDLKEKFKIATLAAVSNYDVSIQLWAEKYRHNLLRPESLWEKNGVTIQLPRETPNHPSYPSGHSGFASATGEVIKHFYGNTEISLSLPADLYSMAETRNWESVDQAIDEAGNSRVISAFHYPLDVTAGNKLGQCVANNVIENFDKRVEEILS
jgi:hypothetical protein